MAANHTAIIPFFLKLFHARYGKMSFFIIIVFLFCALFPKVITKQDPNFQDYNVVMVSPTHGNVFGTDELGRDVLSRIIHGAQISLIIGFISVSIAAGCGILLGLVAGYFGGWCQRLVMAVSDTLWSFPSIMLALALTAVMGPGMVNATIAIGIVNIPAFIRITWAQVLVIREQEYVSAAIAVGDGNFRIMRKHILPNIMNPIYVQMSVIMANAIITESTLSFLGIGIQPPDSSWGTMLRTGYQYMVVAPHLAVIPGLAIFITVLAFHLMGDAIREATDPRRHIKGDK
jgi:peptide/nickel transport system permease protein